MAFAEISECNSYALQRLDSLRSDSLAFGYAGIMRPLTLKSERGCKSYSLPLSWGKV